MSFLSCEIFLDFPHENVSRKYKCLPSLQRSGKQLELRHHILPSLHGFIQAYHTKQVRLQVFNAAVLPYDSQIAQQMPLLPTQEEPGTGQGTEKVTPQCRLCLRLSRSSDQRSVKIC